MKLFDLHCDTITGMETIKRDMGNCEAAINLKKIEKAGFAAYGQCFAMFLSDDYRGQAALRQWEAEYGWFIRQMELYRDVMEQAKSYEDLCRITKEGKTAAVLTTESAAAFAGDLSRISYMREKGCLITSLTWNGATEAAGGVYTPEIGLTAFGREAVAEMERTGMIVDISHMCDRAVDDLMKVARKPFVATHSNCRSVCNAARNLTDEYIQEIIRRKGLIGINYLIYFLREGDPENASMSDVLRHVEHILKLGGEDVIALGSDYDGAKAPKSFDSIEKLPDLYILLQNNLGDRLADKVFFDNAAEFFRINFSETGKERREQ